MLKISKKVEYALMALKYMAQKKTKILFSTREICDEFHMPFDTMSKAMQALSHIGILQSSQGIKGGYLLQKDLSTISYYDLNVLLEGETFGHYCNGPKEVCDQYSHCNIFGPLHVLNNKVIEFFKSINLQDLLIEETPQKDVFSPLHEPEKLNRRMS